MSCELLIADFINNPILIGFPWKGGLSFGTGTSAVFTAVDYSLYDIFFAIAATTVSTKFDATYTILGEWVTFEFSDTQTSAMTAGEWTGHSFLQLKAGGSPEYVTRLGICVINPVPMP
jgi:hypothetical protein